MQPCLVAGLGNPGSRYAGTRHNLGFAVLASLCDRLKVRMTSAEGPALSVATSVQNTGVTLFMPLTFMNNSGMAIAAALQRHEIPLDRLLVVVDDFALRLGSLRIRPGGSDGGHNGLASVIEQLGTTEFARLRLGIMGSQPPAGDEMAAFVLSQFSQEEAPGVRAMVARAADACLSFAGEGLAAAMNRFNTAATPKGPFAQES